MMVDNVYIKYYIVSTITVVVATLSINKMKMVVGKGTACSIVLTLTVEVATISVNKMKIMDYKLNIY